MGQRAKVEVVGDVLRVEAITLMAALGHLAGPLPYVWIPQISTFLYPHSERSAKERTPRL